MMRRLWAALRRTGCPCPFCTAHEAFKAEREARATGLLDDAGDAYRADLPTLAEARQRRWRE